MVDAFTRLEYSLQIARLKALAARFNPMEITAEKNSIGGPLIEQMQREGLRIKPFVTTNASKAAIIEHLSLLLERRALSIPNDPALISELLAFEASSTSTGLTRYEASSGHDDRVMALALGVARMDHGPLRRPQLFAMVAAPDDLHAEMLHTVLGSGPPGKICSDIAGKLGF